jgi:glyceraldehyde 3-phosphate dehydrogenase
MKIIGVNGFGRIGRYFTRLSLDNPNLDVALVNDLADIQTLAHLFKYDSIHGRLKHSFRIEGNCLIFDNGKEIRFVSEHDPVNISWGEYKVDIVIESSGKFLTKELASKHITGGAKRVILSAPAKDDDIKTIVLGVNDHELLSTDLLISNASCTTNSAAPMLQVMTEMCEIEQAFLTTIHSYTLDQRLHDSPHSDLRRGRAAALSMVPTSTGAAKALTKIFPDLKGKLIGSAVRVPVPDGSITDLTMIVRNPPSAEAINEVMKKAADGKLKGILEYTQDPIVSIDVVGNPNSCVFDSQLTVVMGNLVKIMGWYDNEAGYSNRLIDLIAKM